MIELVNHFECRKIMNESMEYVSTFIVAVFLNKYATNHLFFGQIRTRTNSENLIP